MKESPRAKRAVLPLGYQLKLKGNKYGLRLSLMRWRIYPGKVNLSIDNTYLQCISIALVLASVSNFILEVKENDA